MSDERLDEHWSRRPGFVTRKVAGEVVVVPVLAAAQKPEPGGPQLDFFVLNESAQLLWEYLAASRSMRDLARELMNSYQISEERALADCASFLASLKEMGAVAVMA